MSDDDRKPSAVLPLGNDIDIAKESDKKDRLTIKVYPDIYAEEQLKSHNCLKRSFHIEFPSDVSFNDTGFQIKQIIHNLGGPPPSEQRLELRSRLVKFTSLDITGDYQKDIWIVITDDDALCRNEFLMDYIKDPTLQDVTVRLQIYKTPSGVDQPSWVNTDKLRRSNRKRKVAPLSVEELNADFVKDIWRNKHASYDGFEWFIYKGLRDKLSHLKWLQTYRYRDPYRK
jgi:hypothetical protein